MHFATSTYSLALLASAGASLYPNISTSATVSLSVEAGKISLPFSEQTMIVTDATVPIPSSSTDIVTDATVPFSSSFTDNVTDATVLFPSTDSADIVATIPFSTTNFLPAEPILTTALRTEEGVSQLMSQLSTFIHPATTSAPTPKAPADLSLIPATPPPTRPTTKAPADLSLIPATPPSSRPTSKAPADLSLIPVTPSVTRPVPTPATHQPAVSVSALISKLSAFIHPSPNPAPAASKGPASDFITSATPSKPQATMSHQPAVSVSALISKLSAFVHPTPTAQPLPTPPTLASTHAILPVPIPGKPSSVPIVHVTAAAPAQTSACQEGTLLCNGPSRFGICNYGTVQFMPVAAGTICNAGKIVKRGLIGFQTLTRKVGV